MTQQKKKEKHTFRRRTMIVLTIIAVLLIAIHVVLPFYVKKLINQELAEIDPYFGHVEDVDLMLFTGSYMLDSLNIVKENSGKAEPFISVPRTHISLEWKSLFRGRVVGEVEVSEPQFNFVFAETYTQTGAETNWVDLVKDLVPIEINRFAIVNGEVKTKYIRKDLSMAAEYKDLDVEMTNIRNIVNKDEILPSRIHATALSPIKQGRFEFTAQANLIKTMPDMDYDAQFENVELVALNPLMKHETKLDFEKGKLDLYSEMVIKDGKLDGYLKPVLTDAMIYRVKEEDRTFFEGIKELFAEGAQEVLENQKLETMGTKVPITGTIKDVSSDFWVTLIGLLKNAYWESIVKQLDYSVKYGMGSSSNDDKSDSKKKRKEKDKKTSG